MADAKQLKPVRTITIVKAEDSYYHVYEGDRSSGELCWDEMLGQVVELTHPDLGRPRYGMKTAQEWQQWREDCFAPAS